MVAAAPSYLVPMVGRALLGVVIGGLLFDLGGHRATFVVSAALLGVTAIVGALDIRCSPYDGPALIGSCGQLTKNL